MRQKHSYHIAMILASILVTATCIKSPAQVNFNETGMVSLMDPPNNANWSPPNNTGNTGAAVATSNSNKIENAIEWCRENYRTLYIPPGTYVVNRTINIKGNDIYSPDEVHGDKGSPAIIGDAYNRPVIRLRDGTFTGSPSPANANAVFELKHVSQTAAWLYFCILMNVDFDLGNNSGAAAVSWNSAQDSHLRNIKVSGSSFTVGFKSFPGRNQANVDLEVSGGRYGLYLASVGINITGAKLEGQSVAAVYVKNVRGATITGLEVVNCSGDGIVQDNGGNFESSQLYILDASIALTSSSNSAFKPNSRALIAENIYISGTNKILDAADNSKDITVNHGQSFTKINSLALAPSTASNRPTYNYFVGNGGKKVDDLTADYLGVSNAPNDLRTKHLPDEIFAFNHSQAKNALTAYSGSTNEQKIRNALASGDRVIYVPAGQYNFDSPIQLNTNKVLLGDPAKRTYFKSDYNPSGYSYIIETQNTAAGKVVIQDLFFDTQDRPFDGALHWRTGDGFFLNIHNYKGRSFKPDGSILNRFGHIREYDVRIFAFSGNAGGKFYGLADHRTLLKDVNPASDKFRKVYISNTSNPVTFYGLNMERGGANRDKTQQPFVEVKNSSNIRILGMKSEPDTDPQCEVVRFLNCDNVMASSIVTHRKTEGPIVNVGSNSNASNNIQLSIVATADNASGALVNAPSGISSADLLVQYRKGNFQHCLFDGTCGGGGSNNAPTANAGSDVTITLPTNSVVLNGSGSDTDGTISSYSWTKTSGPAATLSGTNTATLTASDLVAGTYVFQLTVTDDDGATGSDQVTVTVNSSGGCQPGNATETATHALYTENGTKKNNDFLRVENKPDGSRKRITYVQFEVDGTCGTITDAQLRFHVEDNGNGTFRVYKGSHSNWTDNSSVGDLPGKDVQVGSYTGSINSGTFDFDVTPGVTGEGKVTFIVEMDQGGNDIRMSSEDVSSTSLRPKLLLDYGSTAGARVKVNDFPSQSLIPGLVIYPNPNQRRFVIAGLKGTYKVQLLNLAGQALSFNFEETSRGLEVIVPGVGSGVYNLVINTGGDIITKRIVIE